MHIRNSLTHNSGEAQCSSPSKWAQCTWYIHTVKYYTVRKSSEALMLITWWVSL